MKTHYQTVVDGDISSIKFDNSAVPYKRKNEVIDFLLNIDTKNMRGDYKELLELVLFYLRCNQDN